jgi:DNA repair protein RadD
VSIERKGNDMFELRDYQTKAVDETRAALRQGPAICVLPTGAGKAVILAHIAKSVQERGKRVLVCAHTQELILQLDGTLRAMGCRTGIIMAGTREDRSAPVQVASIQTLARRQLPDVDLLIVDECHHVRAATYSRVIDAYRLKGAWIVGMTATPERLDGKGLGEFFKSIVEPVTVRELIDRGFLSEYRYLAPHVPEVEKLKKIGGDYARGGLSQLMNRREIVGNAVEHYKRFMDGGQCMAFACGIEHSKAIVEAFNTAGISAAHLDGTTPRAERLATMELFRAGGIRVLSNVGLFGEGVDVPQLRGVLILRPTTSMAMHRQIVGRSLRVAEGKPNAIIIDMSGNWLRHGMPDDICEWDLGDRTRRQDAPKHKTCPGCYAVLPVAVSDCPICGHVFTRKPRTGPDEVDGELHEVKQRKWAKEEKADLYDSLCLEARTRGYLKGWVGRKYRAKTKVWPKGFGDIWKKHVKRCGHVRLDSATERCRFCGVYCGA